MTDFVLNRCNGFILEFFRVVGILSEPKILDHRVVDLAKDAPAVFFVGEQAVDAKQGGSWVFYQGENGII